MCKVRVSSVDGLFAERTHILAHIRRIAENQRFEGPERDPGRAGRRAGVRRADLRA